ncbi:uncharacterized protein Nmag_1545 [Natrialba magadii ATCC 43099]|uniref:Uncharacterized protein n=1 Tax=Natrialba magadii (strain ATCC 43099 / DSM 3394 / CCM 3739 / CIP 104546 / IAM 13178 / JCM 8861 / NBRC 102185 / NCIMB 2190 / MS3) TaxID=547559 RepID=D3STV4_NATMM|nr:hypothetical protein [Natrialba magadii]ADD05121.1 uncharacterized protein Nmag_1545 [Natrialba magadii ATCC 43099]ELY23159.1 hypothetical protein C500_20256 [Natrialba magadii ATCC 43099]
MDKEALPRWGWLLVGLFAMAMIANLLNFTVLGPAGLGPDYQVVTIITAMSPVLIYVGVWYDEDRQHYWEQPREHIIGDVLFVIVGAALGSALALVAIVGLGLWQILQDIIAMGAGFMLSWGLFWWRNPNLYRHEAEQ